MLKVRRCASHKHKIFMRQFRYLHANESLIKGPMMNHSKQIIPCIGIGTWGSDHFSSQEIADSVKLAITECNYKHIDCASIYDNQYEIGQVLLECFNSNIIDRTSLHITSKIWNNEHEYKNVFKSVEKTLKDLNIFYLDLCLIHWPFRNDHKMGAHGFDRDGNAKPFNTNEYIETWIAMNDLLNNGLIRNIGVSNMTITKLEKMSNIIDIKNEEKLNNKSQTLLKYPVVNQCEVHPYFQQLQLLEYCNKHNIIMTAALPLGSPQRPERDRNDDDPVIMNNKILKEISDELNCSVAQLIIAWHINRGTVCVPKATEKWMLEENIKATNLKLSQQHMRRIKNIDKNHRLTKGQVFCWYKGQKWQELWDNE